MIKLKIENYLKEEKDKRGYIILAWNERIETLYSDYAETEEDVEKLLKGILKLYKPKYIDIYKTTKLATFIRRD